MDIQVKQADKVTIVAINGEIDGNTAPQAQEAILAQAQPNCKMILDMSGVKYMSSAGLRLLLVTYRTINAKGGKVVLVGLSENLADTMAITGFLDFLTHRDTLEAGIAALG
jgi:anti-sigma B factor antagonist